MNTKIKIGTAILGASAMLNSGCVVVYGPQMGPVPLRTAYPSQEGVTLAAPGNVVVAPAPQPIVVFNPLLPFEVLLRAGPVFIRGR
jgi:hypothetical protein